MPSFVERALGTVRNGLRLRCPRCGEQKLFEGLFRMREDCDGCGLHYEREPGYFVGAIYVNYAFTAVIALGGYFLVDSFVSWTLAQQIAFWCVFSTVFPLWFFRYSRSLWLALDHVFNPEPQTLRLVSPRAGRTRS